MATLNLGILAHVDAGKTTLTERLLHAAGVIDAVGRVDDGTTQTDSLALERQRGITIKSAVASFVVDGVTINLLDTPGHPDFIAEVERVLGVLDGAVLVVSAVEGVQAQTVVLSRALRRLGVPTIVFLNKIDRVGADVQRTVDAIEERLGVTALVMSGASAEPEFVESATERLAANDDAILAAYLDGRPIDADALHRAIAAQTARLQLLPTYVGAALTGVGVDELMHAIPLLLPVTEGTAAGPPSGAVFKIERAANGEKISFVRMFAGTLRTRDRVQLAIDAEDDTVTAIDVFDHGAVVRRAETRAGDIARLHGLSSARIGDAFGPTVRPAVGRAFAAPALETAVVPLDAAQKVAVFDALSDLAEQDPLINLRQDDTRQELFLSLYGEVQKEIVAQTLSADYGLEVGFRPTTPVCIERPNGDGAAVELIPRHRAPSHPLLATVGLAVSPLPPGSGITFELAVGVKSIPIHVFDSVDNFRALMQRTVEDALQQGLHGWQVTDCRVAMTECGYKAPPRKWPGTTLSDYRLLTPLVLMAALQRAGTTVLEPTLEFHLEFPSRDLSRIMAVLNETEAQPGPPTTRGATTALSGLIRVARVHQLQSRLPDLTRGEGVLETSAAGYTPVRGAPPSRPRTDRNPLDRESYLRQLSG